MRGHNCNNPALDSSGIQWEAALLRYIKRYGEQQPENDSVDAYTDSYGVIHMQPVLISYNRNYADKIVRPENQFEIVGRVL